MSSPLKRAYTKRTLKRGLQALVPKMRFHTNGNIRYNFVVILNIIIGRFFGSADLIVFATEAGLCKAHVKAWTTSFSAKTFYSKPAGIFAKTTVTKSTKSNSHIES